MGSPLNPPAVACLWVSGGIDYSGAQDMRHKLAEKTLLNSATVEAFRKDFLLLMKNTSRIKRDAALLATWRKAMIKWHGRFEEFGAQIRADLEGRIRVNKGKPDYEQKVNLQWAQYYLDNMKPFWDFAWELRSIPNLDLPKSESLEDLKARLLGLDYAKQNGWDEAYVDNYIQDGIARGTVQTPEMGAAKAWGVWDEEVRKWAGRIKSKARGAWKYLNDLAAWTERGGLYGGGAEAIELLEPTVENLTLEGFNLQFVGFPEAGDWLKAYLPTFKAGLGLFRERATRVFPWMIRHMLPLQIQWSGKSINSRDAAATYEGNHITVTLWGASAEPKRVVHVLAHEMGHHVFQTLLSSLQRKDWTTFINGDYTDLDLREVQAQMRSGESLSDFAQRVLEEDPILHLQIESTLHHHSSSHWSLFSVRDIQDHLDAGRPAVIRVPSNPITGYANKNPEEAFCEALGKLVAWGPRTLPDIVNWWMRQMLPNLRTARQDSSLGTQLFIPSKGAWRGLPASAPVKNRPAGKPAGGFWTSTHRGGSGADASDWARFREETWGPSKGEGVLLKPGGQVYTLETQKDYDNLRSQFPHVGPFGEELVDWEGIARSGKWDGIHITRRGIHNLASVGGDNYDPPLYGWDIESTLWLNPSVLEVAGTTKLGSRTTQTALPSPVRVARRYARQVKTPRQP